MDPVNLKEARRRLSQLVDALHELPGGGSARIRRQPTQRIGKARGIPPILAKQKEAPITLRKTAHVSVQIDMVEQMPARCVKDQFSIAEGCFQRDFTIDRCLQLFESLSDGICHSLFRPVPPLTRHFEPSRCGGLQVVHCGKVRPEPVFAVMCQRQSGEASLRADY